MIPVIVLSQLLVAFVPEAQLDSLSFGFTMYEAAPAESESVVVVATVTNIASRPVRIWGAFDIRGGYSAEPDTAVVPGPPPMSLARAQALKDSVIAAGIDIRGHDRASEVTFRVPHRGPDSLEEITLGPGQRYSHSVTLGLNRAKWFSRRYTFLISSGFLARLSPGRPKGATRVPASEFEIGIPVQR
jgi:hypothetical protein